MKKTVLISPFGRKKPLAEGLTVASGSKEAPPVFIVFLLGCFRLVNHEWMVLRRACRHQGRRSRTKQRGVTSRKNRSDYFTVDPRAL